MGALGVYGPLAEFAGCGATVPLTGFGWALSEGVRKAVEEEGFFGVFTGGFTAGAAGTTAAIFFGTLAAPVSYTHLTHTTYPASGSVYKKE